MTKLKNLNLTVGWYRDNAGNNCGRGSHVYAYWNGYAWSARAHESWSAEEAGKQGMTLSSHEPINPEPVGRHDRHISYHPQAELIIMLIESFLDLDTRVLALETKDPTRQINKMQDIIGSIRSGLGAAAAASL